MGECGNPWHFQLALSVLPATANSFYKLALTTNSDTPYHQALGCGLTKAIATQRQRFPIEPPLGSLTSMATCGWPLTLICKLRFFHLYQFFRLTGRDDFSDPP